MSITKCFNKDITDKEAAKDILDRFNNLQSKLNNIKSDLDLERTNIILNELEKFVNQKEEVSELNNIIDENTSEKFLLENNNEIKNKSNISYNSFILFNSQVNKKSFTANEVLENIITNYDNLNDDTLNLINKAKFLLNKTKAKVNLIDRKFFPSKDTFMLYKLSNNTINIDPELIENYSSNFTVQSFLHEVIHSTTVASYISPKRMEENMFKSFIDSAYDYYYKNSENKDLYGFSNQSEFIAEAFTNPTFQKELESISSPESKKSIWNDFVNYIRMIIGLPLKGNDISYNKIVEEIAKVSFIENNATNNSILFKEIEKDQKVKKRQYISPKDKLDNTLDSISNNIKEAMASSEYFLNATKDDDSKARIKSYLEKTKVVLNQIDNYTITNKIEAINTFLSFMETNLDSIKDRINKDITDKDEIIKLAALHDNYLKTFSVINNLKATIADLRSVEQDIINKDDLTLVEDKVAQMLGEYNYINEKVFALKKKSFKLIINNIKYFPDVENKHYKRLSKEYKDSKILEDKESWISKQMRFRDSEIIQQDLDNRINEVIENPSFDVYASDVMFSSAINVSAPLVQILNQILNEIDNKRINEELTKDQEFKSKFESLRKSKGTNDIKKLYSNILDYDANGKPYVIGNYKSEFYTEVVQKISDTKKEYNQKIEDLKLERDKSTEKLELTKEIKNLTKKKNSIIKEIKINNVDKQSDGKYLPKDKWKTNLSNLTKEEKDVRDFFIDIIEESSYKTYGKDSLINYHYGAKFYELPKITKSDIERLWGGDVKGIALDKIKDLKETRPDDIEYLTRNVDQNNEVIKKLRIHYRDKAGNFKNSDQSLDLFSIFRLEYKNANIYKVRKESELELNFLLDIAKNKKYYQKEGTLSVIKNLISGNKELNEVQGKESKTYKMMSNILERRFYDIMNKSNVKIKGADLNKMTSFITSASSALALSFNLASGTANVVNANTQLFLESFIKGDTITAKSIAKANKVYGNHLNKSISDTYSPINNSFVNKLNEYFNTAGTRNFTNSSFVKSDMVKAGLNRQSLQVFQDSGEHWIQSVISMSVLDGIQALDKDSNPIKNKGKNASLLDLMYINEETGVFEVDPKVVYTSMSKLSKWNEGGKEKVDALITKKLYDSIGNYKEIDQPDIHRHWLGKLVMQFRKYLISMGQARLRGVEYSLKRSDELSEDQRRFSYALQKDEEGTYTTLIRYIATAFQDRKYYLLSKSNWENLSDYEKHNIKRSVVELALSWAVLPLAYQFIAAAADDADDEYLFFLAYQLRRLDTEISQYRSLGESFKVMRSPIPSARLIETVGDIAIQTLSPFHWDTLNDTYKAGPNKGENKFKTKIIKQIPVAKEFKRTYEDLYDFQNKSFGTGL